MTDIKRGEQRGGGNTTGVSHPSGGEEGPNNSGADFGTADRATRGTNRDADTSGEARNEGHGHPREERGR